VIYAKTKDVSAQQRTAGPGLSVIRMCSKCNQPKPQLGGSLNRRTRQWVCVGCGAPR